MKANKIKNLEQKLFKLRAYHKLSLRQIMDEIRKRYGVKIHHDTVSEWLKQYGITKNGYER